MNTRMPQGASYGEIVSTEEPQKKSIKKYIFLSLFGIALLFGGIVVGNRYGDYLFGGSGPTIEEREAELNAGLDSGRFTSVLGRVRAVDIEGARVELLDLTLPQLLQQNVSYVHRELFLNESSLLVREDAPGGAHVKIGLSDLKPGQGVTVLMEKNELLESEALVQELILNAYMSLDTNLVESSYGPNGQP